MRLGPLDVAWAKSATDEKGCVYHLLRNHLFDSASVAEIFWREAVSVSLKRFLTTTLGVDESATGRLLIFLAGSHDVGKLTPAFQCKRKERYRQLVANGLPDIPQARLSQGYHGTQTARILDRYLTDHGWSNSHSGALASIIGGHHGTFIKSEEFRDFAPVELGGRQWIQLQLDLLREVAEAAGAHPLPTLTAIPASACVLIAGFVTVCDWIASNKEFFPYEDRPYPRTRIPDRGTRKAKSCLRQLGWTPRSTSTEVDSYQQLFEFGTPSPLQKELLRLAHEPAGPRLFIVEAPMGDGKTEAACAAAEQFRHHLGCCGLYFALPTQATSEQMFDRVIAMLERRWQGSQPQVLALLHGQASLSREYEALLRRGREYFQLMGAGGIDSPAVVAGEWFARSKRGHALPVWGRHSGPEPQGGTRQSAFLRSPVRYCRQGHDHR